MVETTFTETRNSKHEIRNKSQIINLKDIKTTDGKRMKTGEAELDGVLGGGLVAGMVVLVAGEPGIGKSTLLTQVALNVEGPVLYVCGEESASQVALRVKRTRRDLVRSAVSLLESTDVDEIVAKIGEAKPGLVIIDSIQTLTTEDLTGVAGSVGQVREAAQRLASSVKRLAFRAR